MAFIEITTAEIAKVANKLNTIKNASNFEGISNGLTFNSEQNVLLTTISIPMKLSSQDMKSRKK